MLLKTVKQILLWCLETVKGYVKSGGLRGTKERSLRGLNVV